MSCLDRPPELSRYFLLLNTPMIDSTIFRAHQHSARALRGLRDVGHQSGVDHRRHIPGTRHEMSPW
jgi:hypothetical protein